MAKKSEVPEFYCLRKGSALYPEMGADLKMLEAFPQNQRIKVTLSTGRYPPRLRFWWSFLQKVVDATECCVSAEALNNVAKLHTGLVTPVMVKNMTVMVPKSISYASMSEPEFNRFVDAGVKFIIETYGIAPEDVFKGE